MSAGKVCGSCREFKPVSDFLFQAKKGSYRSYCNPCERAYQRKYQYLPRYGVKLDELEKLLRSQDCECAICQTPLASLGIGAGHVDHCHSTGKVRGVLCQLCNTALGNFKDNPERLRRAANYIEEGGL